MTAVDSRRLCKLLYNTGLFRVGQLRLIRFDTIMVSIWLMKSMLCNLSSTQTDRQTEDCYNSYIFLNAVLNCEQWYSIW